MTKRPLIAGLVLALWAALSAAEQQSPLPQTVGTITTQNLTPSSANTVGSAVCADVSAAGAVTVQTQGTYTGALSATVSNDGLSRTTLGSTKTFLRFSTDGTSATIASGVQDVFQVGNITGVRTFCVTALGAVTGSVTVTLQPALVAAAGSTSITGGGDATAANQAAGNASLASIDGKLSALGTQAIAASLSVTPATSATFPVSAASLPLPTGAATAAKQPALGTAGASSTDVISVQGIASGTALPASQSGTWSTRTQDGTGNALTSATRGAERALSVQLVDASGNQIVTFGGSGGTASTVGAATPATATAIGGNDGANMQVPRVADLDTGAGSQYSLIVSPRLGASGGGVELTGGAGAVAPGTLRITQASDSPLVSTAGAPADAVCASDTGTCSQIALSKRIAQQISAANPQLPTALGATTSAGSLSVTPATNAAFVLGAGSATIGALTANQSVNVAQINGVTPLMGAGNTGTGSHRVTVATDQAAIATAGQGATGAAVPSGATQMGARTGANMEAVTQGSTSVAINVSTATTTQLVALASSQQIRVTGLTVVAGGTGNITFVYGTGANCGTGTTSISGAIPLVANVGFTMGAGLGPVLIIPASQALCVTTSAAVQMSGWLTYAQY